MSGQDKTMWRDGDGPAETPDSASRAPQSVAPLPGTLGSHEGFIQPGTAGVPLALQGHYVPEALLRESSRASVIEPESVPGESGRTYHGYREGKYFMPNDPGRYEGRAELASCRHHAQPEQDRLDFQHACVTMLLGGRLALAPLKPAPRRVLDIATGTGIWALEFAQQNPGALVVGTNLSRIQPTDVVPNCIFVKEDSEEPWAHGHAFDYIHLRFGFHSFNNPRCIVQHAFQHLDPGDWLEYQDTAMDFVELHGNLEGTGMARWAELMRQAGASLGRDLLVAYKYKTWMEEEGFVDVREVRIPWPSSPWPADATLRTVGMYQRTNFLIGLHAISFKMLRNLGLSPEAIG